MFVELACCIPLQYGADDVRKVLQLDHSQEDFFDIVGYAGPESVVHRNNVCLWIPFGEEPSADDHPATENHAANKVSSSSDNVVGLAA